MKKKKTLVFSAAFFAIMSFAQVAGAMHDAGGGGGGSKPPTPICDNKGNCMIQ
ncbi:hypothetical protein HNO89_004423 [Sporosarcina luteola]|nr:hypothetical protein [Sporosarcina luteola]